MGDKEKLVEEMTKDLLVSKYGLYSAGDFSDGEDSTIAMAEWRNMREIAEALIDSGWTNQFTE